MPAKLDKTLWQENTEGLCPTCLLKIPARLYRDNDQIWLETVCPQHGINRALLASDAEQYLRLRHFTAPRLSGSCYCGPEENSSSCTPPVCVLLLEITNACNLRCPTCYADASGHDFMPIEEAKRRLDAFFLQQSKLDVLMLSGGEPTIHPRFIEILDLALSYPIEQVLINTNGLRIAQSDSLCEALHIRKKRIELYFSFSGFRLETHLHLYGKDLRVEKERAMQRAMEAKIFTNLVVTLERGMNDDEAGELLRYAFSKYHIAGIILQPAMSSGRYEHSYQPETRLTLTDTLHLLEEQSEGILRVSDVAALPCSHPDCCALTYGVLRADRSGFVPLTRHLDIGRYLELFADRISFAGLVGAALKRVWNDMTHMRGRQTLSDMASLFAEAGVRDLIPLIGKPEEAGKRLFRVVVKPFMDAHTFDWQRAEQCCTKILDENGKSVSFCEYNVLHRSRKSRANLQQLRVLS